jgi:hypothetical protein
MLVRRPEGKTPLGRPERRWEYIVKTTNSMEQSLS